MPAFKVRRFTVPLAEGGGWVETPVFEVEDGERVLAVEPAATRWVVTVIREVAA